MEGHSERNKDTPSESGPIATLTTASPSRTSLGKILGVQTLKTMTNLQRLPCLSQRPWESTPGGRQLTSNCYSVYHKDHGSSDSENFD